MARDREDREGGDAQANARGESREYQRRYDPDNDRSYGLPSRTAQQELAHAERKEQEAMLRHEESRLRAAQYNQEQWPDVGNFSIPPQNTFAAHRAVVMANDGALLFNPQAFPGFDAIIAERAQRPELFDPSHPDYAKYAALRLNLAVLRNDVMGIYMDDGSFDPGDEKFVPLLEGVAREIGDGLRNERTAAGKIFWPKLNTQLLNMEGDGAVYAYQYVLKRQRTRGLLASAMDDIYRVVNLPLRHFDLPPPEATPFTTTSLSLHADDAPCTLPAPAAAACAPPPPPAVKDKAAPAAIPASKQNVDVLTSAERQESAEHGRIILDFFKNLKLTGKDMQEAMDNGTPQQQAALLLQLQEALDRYDSVMDHAWETRPLLMQRKSVEKAEEAAEELEHAIKLLAEKVKPIALSQAQAISADMRDQPSHLHQQDKHNLGELCDRMADGMSEAFAEAQEYQQEQMQEQEEQREAVEQSLLAHDLAHGQGGRRRRRRRQQSGRGGANVSARRKTAHDRQGDGIDDRFQVDRVQAVVSGKPAIGQPAIGQPLQSSPMDNALSKALAQTGQEVRALAGVQLQEVKAGDSLRPDDRSAQDMVKDLVKRERERQGKPPL
ncbi:MAG: hypothetical protein JO089_00870 [Alphaproteobacteria bacterium]|nr:hypothetical protein [Alphaproteobacteria bacterium]